MENSEQDLDAVLNRMVDEHVSYLFRYATRRVRDSEAVEDLVQETFMAAIKGLKKFRRASSERTWLTGILKYKIIDHYRLQSRNNALFQDVPEPDELEQRLIQSKHWNSTIGPGNWSADPALLAESGEFYEILRRCLEALPERMAAVFRMRVLEDLPSGQLTDFFQCSPENLRTILHRARFGLRRCLETNWFTDD